MKKKGYYLISAHADRKDLIDQFKKRLETLEIYNVTEDEVLEVLFEKDKRVSLKSDEVKRLISKRRGIG